MNNSICIRNVGLTVHIIHIFLNVKANCYMLIDTYHLFFFFVQNVIRCSFPEEQSHSEV